MTVQRHNLNHRGEKMPVERVTQVLAVLDAPICCGQHNVLCTWVPRVCRLQLLPRQYWGSLRHGRPSAPRTKAPHRCALTLSCQTRNSGGLVG